MALSMWSELDIHAKVCSERCGCILLIGCWAAMDDGSGVERKACNMPEGCIDRIWGGRSDSKVKYDFSTTRNAIFIFF